MQIDIDGERDAESPTTSRRARCSCTSCATQSGLNGTNIGCDTTSCGACTVLLNGQSVKSCTVLAAQADGRGDHHDRGAGPHDGRMHPVQQAFQERHGLQCGYCTPGMVMAVTSLLAENPEPTEEDIRLGLEGNLCRCTGYHNIVAAALAASRAWRRPMIPPSSTTCGPARLEEADRVARRARRRRQALGRWPLAAAAHEVPPRRAGAARGHRTTGRPQLRERERRTTSRRGADPSSRHRRQRGPPALERSACSPTSPDRSVTPRSDTAARSEARSPTATRPRTCPRCCWRSAPRWSRGARRESARSRPGTTFRQLSSKRPSRPTSCSSRSASRARLRPSWDSRS